MRAIVKLMLGPLLALAVRSAIPSHFSSLAVAASTRSVVSAIDGTPLPTRAGR